MILILLDLIDIHQVLLQLINPVSGNPCPEPSCAKPCSAVSPLTRQVRLLSASNHQEGQHEKNVNQRDSGRRVADGNGRWPAPV
jgi:hypothetical protein